MAMTGDYNVLQSEYLDTIKDEIQRGIIKIEKDDQYFSILEDMYPVVGSGIAWDEVPDALFLDLEGLKENREVYDAALQKGFAEIIQRIQGLEIDEDQEVVVLGDNIFNVALRIPLKKLSDVYRGIFDLPQHTYILPPDASWCINFTFEHRLYFGKAPN